MIFPKSTFIENFSLTASTRGDAPAITFLDATLTESKFTHSELYSKALEIGNNLKNAKIRKDAPLAILLPSQKDQVLHFLGAMFAGHHAVILTPPHRKLNLEYYTQTTNSLFESGIFSAVITDIDVEPALTPLFSPYKFESSDFLKDSTSSSEAGGFFYQFTSGTTNIKNGVVIRESAVLAQISTYAKAIELTSSDIIISWLPLSHDMGFIACMCMPLLCGAHVVMMEPTDWVAKPVSFLSAASKYKATLAWNPNFAYAFMADRIQLEEMAGLDISSFRGLINCSELVTHESQNRFISKFSKYGLKPGAFWGCYAMAETGFALTHAKGSDLQPKLSDNRVRVGKPLPQVEIRVIDESGKSLPEGKSGELLVRCPFLFDHYLNNPTKTKTTKSQGWFGTGDIGYLIDGELVICGRKKEMVISAGANFFPQDIELEASKCQGVIPGRIAAFGVFDSKIQTEKIIVIAETTLDKSARTATLIEIRSRIIAAFLCAHLQVHLVEPGWLIKSTSGKMARLLVRDKWLMESAPH